MDIIVDSVNRLEEILACSGCEETGVRLDVDPDAHTCQFERGACMTASFGGRTAEFVTDNPIRAMTKTSFMFGAPLDNPGVRGAACAIINVATAFFCLSRVRRACPVASHGTCLKELAEELAGRRIFCTGELPALHRERSVHLTEDIHEADTVLVNNEGVIAPDLGDLLAAHGAGKRVIWLGPSTAGVCRLQQGEHWCPYGQPLPESVPDPSRQNG
jgi:hypothetical protein